ncbi:hypothetical protein JHK87_026385 [Glycine soja]|nr:hypothetical protein JHK87_026385 [Glycine soja]
MHGIETSNEWNSKTPQTVHWQGISTTMVDVLRCETLGMGDFFPWKNLFSTTPLCFHFLPQTPIDTTQGIPTLRRVNIELHEGVPPKLTLSVFSPPNHKLNIPRRQKGHHHRRNLGRWLVKGTVPDAPCGCFGCTAVVV